MAKTYAVIVGVILLIWGIIGLFTGSFLGIALSAGALQTWLFIVAGILGVWLGFAGKGTKKYAQWFGVIFVLGGLLGFILPGVMDAITLDNGLVANVVHLVAGLWGLWAGFGKKNQMTGPATPPTPPTA